MKSKSTTAVTVLITIVVAAMLMMQEAAAFTPCPDCVSSSRRHLDGITNILCDNGSSISSSLCMAKVTKKKKAKKGGGKSGGGGSSGLKGFGSVGGSSSSSSSSSASAQVELDRSKQAMAFYDFMEQQKAGDNLSRCALGYFPLGDNGEIKLRGVTALRPIKKGDAIIRIPYEMAVNLGQEGSDPTIPAVALLRDY
ncbi:MAG: hypothetical protein SGARI_006843, partial [Bacillariaceae sp.]